MKKSLKILLLYLISLSSIYSQTSGGFFGDCGEHTFRIIDKDSLGLSEFIYIERNNKCPDEQELILDFYFWAVPDKIDIYDYKDSLIMSTGFVGHYWYQPCTQGQVTVGYVEYHNSEVIMTNGFPPFDFMRHPDPMASFQRDGLGRIKITTASKRLKIVWTASTCGPTYTDMFIRCTTYILQTYHNSTYTEFLCDESETYRDTIFGDCGYDVFEGLFGGQDGRLDTICGMYGQEINHNGKTYIINGDDIDYIDRVNARGCEYQDTVVIIEQSLYIPNVVIHEYYLNPEVEFDIYDRWGNKVYTGTRWDARNVEIGVYVVRVYYKGNIIIEDLTVLK